MPQRDQSVPLDAFLARLHNSERIAYLLLQTGVLNPFKFLGGQEEYFGPAGSKKQSPSITLLWVAIFIIAMGYAVRRLQAKPEGKSEITNNLI